MRAFLIRLLEFRAKRALRRHVGIQIHPTAKVAFRKIRYRPGMTLTIGAGSIVEASLVAEREGASITIGRNTFIGASLLAAATSIEVGDDVLISWGCNIVDHNSHAVAWSQRTTDVSEWYHDRKDWTPVVVKPVRIMDKSWVGLNTIILKGVEVGEGAVVAAGSVVTKSVPPWTIAAGNPAKVIREIPLERR